MPGPLKAFWELRHLPRAVWVISTAALINRLGTMALPFLSLYLARDRHFSATDAGLVLALYGAAALVASPISGKLVDAFGAKRVMVASFVATGGFVVLVPWAPGVPLLAGAVVCWALSNEIFRPAMLTRLSGAAEPARRKQAFALNRWAVNLGMSVGPAAGGLLADVSFKLVFLVDGATTLVAVAVLALFLEPEADVPAAAGNAEPRHPFVALRDPLLAIALLALLPQCVLAFQMDTTVPLVVVQALGHTPADFGLMVAVNTLMIVFLEIPVNHATAAWPHRRTLLVGAVFFAAGFAAYGLASSLPALMAVTALWTVGEMVGAPAISAFVADIAPPAQRGSYMGVYMMTWSVAYILAPAVGTQLLAQLGPKLVFPALGAIGALSAVGFLRLPRTPSAAAAPTR